MKHTIPCYCDTSFVVEVPEEIDLDAEGRYVEELIAGTFMNFTCAHCGKKHKPEFPLIVRWPSKGLCLEALPETERGAFYRRKGGGGRDTAGKDAAAETVIGYPELAERVAMVKDGLAPEAVEALKYYLLLKADENYPDNELSVWYQGTRGDTLEFHIHGMKQGEVAVMKVPADLYESTRADFKKHPRKDEFARLRVQSYLSIQNILRPEELK